MSLGKKSTIPIGTLIILVTAICSTLIVKSVYAVADTEPDGGGTPVIHAYDVQDANLVLQGKGRWF